MRRRLGWTRRKRLAVAEGAVLLNEEAPDGVGGEQADSHETASTASVVAPLNVERKPKARKGGRRHG